jgi:NADH-quinone oxidoreductase subunit G
VLNTRLRRRYLTGQFKIGVIGPALELTYKYTHLGDGGAAMADLVAGKGPFAEILTKAEHPMVILGMGALSRADGAAVLAGARTLAETFGMIKEDWNGFNVLHRAAARVGALDVGFVPGEGGRDLAGILAGAEAGEIDLVYLHGADEIDTTKLGKAFVIYQGHTGDAGAARADVILPGAAYTEKNATYVNTEGRVQQAKIASFPPGEAREDWKIVRALAQTLGVPLRYDNLGQLRTHLETIAPAFLSVDQVTPAPWAKFGGKGTIDPAPFVPPITDFYLTDPISRASDTMARCSELYVHGVEPVDNQELAATYG